MVWTNPLISLGQLSWLHSLPTSCPPSSYLPFGVGWCWRVWISLRGNRSAEKTTTSKKFHTILKTPEEKQDCIFSPNSIKSYEGMAVWSSLSEIPIKYKSLLEMTVFSVAAFQFKNISLCFSKTAEILQYQPSNAVPHTAVSFLFKGYYLDGPCYGE